MNLYFFCSGECVQIVTADSESRAFEILDDPSATLQSVIEGIEKEGSKATITLEEENAWPECAERWLSVITYSAR